MSKKLMKNIKKSVNRGNAMKSKTIIKLSISAAIVALPTTGCASFINKQSNISSTAKAGEKKAAKWAAKADRYLVEGKINKAVVNAERAVEADFRNSAYRSTLARGYIAQGRFNSAERTLQDVLDLGQKDPRTIVSLALLRTAQGKTVSAISLLDSYRDILPVGDYGLALAVAGDKIRSVEALESGVRNSNTAQLRQNLALAYALNGQWREARVMASQDLTGSQVNENISKWAQYARPNAYQQRVAGLLGVSPQQDSGQPVRLALDSRSNPNVDFAANTSSGELPAIGPAPVSLVDNLSAAKENNVKVAPAAVKAVSIPASKPAPLIQAPKGPSKSAAKAPVKLASSAPSKFIVEDANGSVKGSVPKPSVAKVVPKRAAAKPAAKKPVKLALANTARRKTASRRLAGGAYMIQLGAFSSSKNAQAAWGKLTKEYSVLKPFRSASSVVNSNGRQLYRLAAMGFGNLETATSICNRIKSKGGSCIVRKNTNKTPVRLASK